MAWQHHRSASGRIGAPPPSGVGEQVGGGYDQVQVNQRAEAARSGRANGRQLSRYKHMDIQAVFFDTGGTVLDWHGGLFQAFEAAGAAQGISGDWHDVVNDWRRRTMKGIVGQRHPGFHMDDVHRQTLDQSLEHFGLQAFDATTRDGLWRTWHQLPTWPDFGPALAGLRQRLPVVSFTMLPTALVVNVSRRNVLVWDAIISCEMIDVYKPHPEAYHTAARWMNLRPAQVLMVACHNFDLSAAQDAGMRTAFVRRPDEWGPAGPPDPKPNRDYDLVEDCFAGLLKSVLARVVDVV